MRFDMICESGITSEQAKDVLSRRELCELIQKNQDMLAEKFNQGLRFTHEQEKKYIEMVETIKQNGFYRKYIASNFREER